MSKSTLLAAFALVLGCAGQAAAAPAAAVPAQTVSTTGVDFRDQAAVRAVYASIEQAAYRVCDAGWPNSRLGHRDTACVSDAVNRAVQAANRPLLTAQYDTSIEAHASR